MGAYPQHKEKNHAIAKSELRYLKKITIMTH